VEASNNSKTKTKTSKYNNQSEVEVEVTPINTDSNEVEEAQVDYTLLQKDSKEDIIQLLLIILFIIS